MEAVDLEECIHEIMRASCHYCTPRGEDLTDQLEEPIRPARNYNRTRTAAVDTACESCGGLIYCGDLVRSTWPDGVIHDGCFE